MDKIYMAQFQQHPTPGPQVTKKFQGELFVL